VLFRTALKRLRSFRNPGGFDYVHYQAGKRSLPPVLFGGRTAFDKDGARIRDLICLDYECDKRPNRSLPGKTRLWAQRSLDPELINIHDLPYPGCYHWVSVHMRSGCAELLSPQEFKDQEVWEVVLAVLSGSCF
jgi:hypothetical protein